MESEYFKKCGNSYSFGEIKLGVGRESAKAFLKQDKELIKKVRKQVMIDLAAKQE